MGAGGFPKGQPFRQTATAASDPTCRLPRPWRVCAPRCGTSRTACGSMSNSRQALMSFWWAAGARACANTSPTRSKLQQAHVEACGCSPAGLRRVMARRGAARCTGCGPGSGAAGRVYAMPTGDAKPRTQGSEYRCASGGKEWAHPGEDCLSGAHQCAIAWMPQKPTLVPARGRLANIQAQDIRRCPWGRGGSLGL